MKRTLAAAITGAVFAGVLSAGVAQAKVVSTSLIGGTGIRNAEDGSEVAVASQVLAAGKRVSATKANFHGEVRIAIQDAGDLAEFALGCFEERSIILQRYTQVAGAGTRKARDDRFEWKTVKETETDLEGIWAAKGVSTRKGSFRAKVTKDAFTTEYGDLIACKAATSKAFTV